MPATSGSELVTGTLEIMRLVDAGSGIGVRGAKALRCLAGLSGATESSVVSGVALPCFPSKRDAFDPSSVDESVSFSSERIMLRNSSTPIASELFSRANVVICKATSPSTIGAPHLAVYESITSKMSFAVSVSPPCSSKRVRTTLSSQRDMLIVVGSVKQTM